jgi:hypothetical protein
MNEGVNKEEGKIAEVFSQISSATKELKDQILPDLRTKLSPILYSLPCEKDNKEEAPMAEGSKLLMALEEHRRNLVIISNFILEDIHKQIEL